MDSKHDSFVVDPSYDGGVVPLRTRSVWATSKRGFIVHLSPHISVCNKGGDGETPCTKGWVDFDSLTQRFTHAIDVPMLREKCTEINRDIDPAFSYRIDNIIKYLCVEEANPNLHLRGRDVAFTHELGRTGFTPGAVVELMAAICRWLQRTYMMRIHHVISIEVRLARGTIAVGGCPELVKRYRTLCHPAVCVCQDDRRPGNLCHHWFMDSLLGGDMDVKTAHPSVTFSMERGRATHYRHLIHTCTRVVDDVVWGGVLRKLGLTLHLYAKSSTKEFFAYTEYWHNRIRIGINTAKNPMPQHVGQTLLHECAHARVLHDTPDAIIRGDGHGHNWLHRMSDIRTRLAYRLAEETTAVNRLISHTRRRIWCDDCSFSTRTSNPENVTVCPECFSMHVNVETQA
jgi:hypothetical protein